MNETARFLIDHGLPIVFVAVFIEQMGLPLPAIPWLLAVGALSTNHQFNLGLGIGAAIMACLIADAFWFYLGRIRGNRVLGFLCRISLEPDSCVRRTLNIFTRYGIPGVVVAKFLPGMSTIIPPLAGMSGIKTGRFFLFDALGSLLYGSVFIFLGCIFSHQITQIGMAITHIGGNALTFLVSISALYLGYKYWHGRRLLHELRLARITAKELRQKMDAGEKPVILDLRSQFELESNPLAISGAIHLEVEEIAKHQHEFPRDRDIVLYYSCPNEAAAAGAALLLQHEGFTRVRPLLGGIDAWRHQEYPMGTLITKITPQPATPLWLNRLYNYQVEGIKNMICVNIENKIQVCRKICGKRQPIALLSINKENCHE